MVLRKCARHASSSTMRRSCSSTPSFNAIARRCGRRTDWWCPGSGGPTSWRARCRVLGDEALRFTPQSNCFSIRSMRSMPRRMSAMDSPLSSTWSPRGRNSFGARRPGAWPGARPGGPQVPVAGRGARSRAAQRDGVETGERGFRVGPVLPGAGGASLGLGPALGVRGRRRVRQAGDLALLPGVGVGLPFLDGDARVRPPGTMHLRSRPCATPRARRCRKRGPGSGQGRGWTPGRWGDLRGRPWR